MRYDLSDQVRLRAGVNNLLDRDPPLTSLAGFGGGEDAGRGNTFPQIYDAQGRYVFAGATLRF
jgi:outer membrane receptor protein involved in Fe transport